MDLAGLSDDCRRIYRIKSDGPYTSYGLTSVTTQGEKGRLDPSFTYISGVGSGARIRVHTNSHENILRGVITRVLTVKYDARTVAHRLERDASIIRRGKDGIWPEGSTESWKLRTAMAVTGARSVGYGVPFPPVWAAFDSVSFKDYLRCVVDGCAASTSVDVMDYHKNYRGRRSTVYRNAGQSLDHVPLTRRDFKIKAFVKREKLNFTSKEDPDPRIIQPSDPRANTALGRHIRSMEGPIMKSVAKVWGGPTVTKGYTAFEVGEIIREAWDQFYEPVAVGLDASRYDQTVSVEAQRYEHKFYLSLVEPRYRRELAQLLEYDICKDAIAYSDAGKIKYKLPGSRGSGSMTTGMGNCIIMTAMVYSWRRSCGVPFRLINNGDDCVAIMEKRDLHRFQHGLYEHFCDLGFTIEAEEPVYELEHVKFCQAAPLYDGQRWRVVRDPHVTLSKDAVCLLPNLTAESYATWLDSVGKCGLSLAGDMPVLCEYYKMFVRSAQDIARTRNKVAGHALLESGMIRLAAGLEPRYSSPTPEARASFAVAFGILPETQLELERYYRMSNVSSNQTPESGTSGIWFNSVGPMGLLG
nr:MAG: reverse transcriptase-like protein [Hangzhou tombus-like virus 1]